MRVYLAGPMTGLPALNFPAFHEAASDLRADGHLVFNPAEASAADSNADYYRLCMVVNLTWIACQAEAIALLPGWENSKGAKAELALSEALGHKVIYL